MASELHLGESNWKFFQVGYPVDTPTDKELPPWRLELEIVPSRLPCGHPYRQGASSLETRTGNFPKAVTLWTPPTATKMEENMYTLKTYNSLETLPPLQHKRRKTYT